MERKRNIQPARDARPLAPISASLASANDAGADRRVRNRRDMTSGNSVAAVRLVDLSTHGCCLGFATAIEYRPGQFIRLGFSGEAEAIRAIVRWIEAERIGAEFTSELSDARVEAILGEGSSPLVGLL